MIRGIDSSEVNSRTQIKSMLSAKSFRPSINTAEQATKWLRIFIADIYSRLVDEGVVENKRRPRVMNLHHRQGGQTRSRQAPIQQGRKIDEASLFDLAKTLLGQIIMEGRVWPCANLSLSVGGFEEGVVGNMGIGAFLVKGDEAKAINSGSRDTKAAQLLQEKPEKRRRLDSPAGIQRFFVKTESLDEHDDDFGAQDSVGVSDELAESKDIGVGDNDRAATFALFDENERIGLATSNETGSSALRQDQITNYLCERCNMPVDFEDVQSHQDWHFAKDLQDEDQGSPSHTLMTSATTGTKKITQNSNKKKSGRARPEKGQTKLPFG